MARYRLTENRLRGMIREAVKSALTEGVAMKKGIHEKPHIKVKQSTLKYNGRDPKGILYNIYVDGAPMFRASLVGSEYDSWNGGTGMQKGTYSEIYIRLDEYGKSPISRMDNSKAFRDQIGFEKNNDLNIRQAQENIKQMCEWARVSFCGKFVLIEDYSMRFTPENAPYIIQKFVEGLLTPVENIKRKSTDEVTFYDVYEGDDVTMNLQDAYHYAKELYVNICREGYGDSVRKPNEYEDIEDCLCNYVNVWERIDYDYREPEDWYERVEHGDFDEY